MKPLYLLLFIRFLETTADNTSEDNIEVKLVPVKLTQLPETSVLVKTLNMDEPTSRPEMGDDKLYEDVVYSDEFPANAEEGPHSMIQKVERTTMVVFSDSSLLQPTTPTLKPISLSKKQTTPSPRPTLRPITLSHRRLTHFFKEVTHPKATTSTTTKAPKRRPLNDGEVLPSTRRKFRDPSPIGSPQKKVLKKPNWKYLWGAVAKRGSLIIKDIAEKLEDLPPPPEDSEVVIVNRTKVRPKRAASNSNLTDAEIDAEYDDWLTGPLNVKQPTDDSGPLVLLPEKVEVDKGAEEAKRLLEDFEKIGSSPSTEPRRNESREEEPKKKKKTKKGKREKKKERSKFDLALEAVNRLPIEREDNNIRYDPESFEFSPDVPTASPVIHKTSPRPLPLHSFAHLSRTPLRLVSLTPGIINN